MLRVEMLSTGDEVLHGQIVDTNAAWLADYFFQQGLPLTSRSTVGDDLDILIDTLKLRSQYADILIVNGGLGPTSDDLSAQAAAMAKGDVLVEHAEWIARMEAWFAERGRVMAESNRKQAMLPRSAQFIDNPVGTACGFALKLNRCLMFFTPGVPSEFKVMIDSQIMPMIRDNFSLPQPPLCLRLTSFGRSESRLAQQFDSIALPDDVVLGYRSSMPIIELKLTGPADSREKMLTVWQQIKGEIAENVLYEGTEGLPSLIACELRSRGLTLALCEHTTAGLLNLQLNAVSAPVHGDECLPSNNPLTLVELAKIAQDTAQRYQTSLALVTGNFEGAEFSLALLTPNGVKAWRIRYLARPQGVAVQQDMVALFALDTLRRWLNNWSDIGHYEWLELIETFSND